MNYSDKLALIREYKTQGGKGSYLSLLKSYEEGGNLLKYDGEGESQLPIGIAKDVPAYLGNSLIKPWVSPEIIAEIASSVSEADTNKYTVQSGDTLSRIAHLNKTDLNSIKRLNPNIKDINKIFPGQEIIISQKIKSSLPKVF